MEAQERAPRERFSAMLCTEREDSVPQRRPLPSRLADAQWPASGGVQRNAVGVYSLVMPAMEMSAISEFATRITLGQNRTSDSFVDSTPDSLGDRPLIVGPNDGR